MSLNGSLAGLVAITAACDTVSPASAAIIGIISGFVVVFGIEFIDKVLKVDDPVGAVGVHGLNGAFGTLAVGLFLRRYRYRHGKVLLTGGGFHGFRRTAYRYDASPSAWVAVTMTIIFQATQTYGWSSCNSAGRGNRRSGRQRTWSCQCLRRIRCSRHRVTGSDTYGCH